MVKKSFVPLVASVSLLAIIIGIGIGFWFSQHYPPKAPIEGLLPQTQPLTAFSLVNQQEKPFTLDSLRGKWTFLFFGYTHCPDICPLALSVLKGVKQSLATLPEAADTQFVFVSVDGERDTPALLAQYVHFFDPDFIGVSGVASHTLELTRQLGVIYFRAPQQADGSYLVDHSSAILLVNPDAQFVGLFPAPHVANSVLNHYLKIRHYLEKKS
ncbi:SCO family protein [Beggiatoa leptomitoformis]|uniref:Redoxin domain-containing protein n=1 Tax=Beggiatoa leptomitoformis TaxID=288004 RepID=A0A2N9YCL0_9GAMM|nr:SCO family protein [Beggiatoa leptomitoformis]AUI68209.1 redoxin domain-containing protein [Beggiatoa leptomitoformis]QGX03438.1 redoxin domain-containing protein [Beggiatoa leptomitoformis]